jgi:hypothetical protein
MIILTSLRNYHEICHWHFGWRHYCPVSTNVSVKVGSVRRFPGLEYETSFEVASTDCTLHDEGWSTMDPIVNDYWLPYVAS